MTKIAPFLCEGVFFAHPASPWQRGANESPTASCGSTSPKRTDLSVHTAADLTAVEECPSRWPHKTLEWRTPADIFRPT
jgi:IS30 family transposase